MNDKERLEMIKGIQKRIKECQEKGQNVSNLHSDYVDWLIEQAEKVEQLQQENEKLNQVIDWMNEGCEYNNESHLKTYKQLQQAQAKAERYEKVLKQIASHELFTESYFCDLEANELIYKAQEALEGLNENAK